MEREGDMDKARREAGASLISSIEKTDKKLGKNDESSTFFPVILFVREKKKIVREKAVFLQSVHK